LATDVSICSNALLMLGDKAISSLNPPDNTDAAGMVANIYPQIRDKVLRAHPWNCAVKRVILAPDATAPAFDYDYQFQLPSDWLRTLQVGQRDDTVDYRMEGRKILCNESVFYLKYVFQNTVESTYDSMLVHIMTLAVRAAIAYGITKSSAMATLCLQEYAAELKIAKSVDGVEEPPEQLGDERLFAAGFMSSD
jgi:hypothetical protein